MPRVKSDSAEEIFSKVFAAYIKKMENKSN